MDVGIGRNLQGDPLRSPLALSRSRSVRGAPQGSMPRHGCSGDRLGESFIGWPRGDERRSRCVGAQTFQHGYERLSPHRRVAATGRLCSSAAALGGWMPGRRQAGWRNPFETAPTHSRNSTVGPFWSRPFVLRRDVASFPPFTYPPCSALTRPAGPLEQRPLRPVTGVSHLDTRFLQSIRSRRPAPSHVAGAA